MNPLIACLHLLPPEMAHKATLAALQMGLAPRVSNSDSPILAMRLWGKNFSNPIGLAAGFDKNAEVILPMLRMGFGFVEVGTVTPRPQSGNPKPRIFRWPEEAAVINRLGFNNKGLQNYCRNLERVATHPVRQSGVVGGNIGRNKDSADAIADYVTGLEAVAPYVDYLTINISSPNTAGLRGLQNRDELQSLLRALLAKRQSMAVRPPLLVKIAPDLDEQACEDIAEVMALTLVDGLVISNTTIARPAHIPARLAKEAGGLSGKPVFESSNEILKRMAALTKKKIPIIGVGGVQSAQDAYVKIKSGASLVQLYTGLIYHGPQLVPLIKTGLAELLRRDGYANIKDAIGADVKI